MAKFLKKKKKKHQLYSEQKQVHRSARQAKENVFKTEKIANKLELEQSESNFNSVQQNDNSLILDSLVEEDKQEGKQIDALNSAIYERIYNQREKPNFVEKKESNLHEEKIEIEAESPDYSQQSPKNLEQLDLEQDTNEALSHYQKALEMYQQEDYEQCILELEEALSLTSDNLEFVYWLGMSHYQLQQLDRAIDYFRESSHTADKQQVLYVEAFFWLGEIYRLKKELKLAIYNYEKFLALSSQSIYDSVALKYLSELKFELLFNQN